MAEPAAELRIFIAVAIEPEVRYGLATHLGANLPADGLPGSSPPPENWHITLRFIGRTGQTSYERLLAELDQSEFPGEFVVTFGGLGAFPNPKRATVLWLGVEEGAGELAQLAGVVEDATVRAGFVAEERPFHPHLTLSRVRPPQDVRQLIADMPVFPLSQTVTHVTLFESHLRRGPAVYAPLERFALA